MYTRSQNDVALGTGSVLLTAFLDLFCAQSGHFLRGGVYPMRRITWLEGCPSRKWFSIAVVMTVIGVTPLEPDRERVDV